MKEEDKELILKDICFRLPYNIKVHIKGEYKTPIKVYTVYIEDKTITYFKGLECFEEYIENIKLYLRSMSSMTEDERNEYFSVKMRETERVALAEIYRPEAISEIIDWLNAHHFDYRGLIEKGLAIEVDKDFYK